MVGSEGEGTGEDGDQEQVDGEKGKGDGRGGEDRVESVRESSGMVKKEQQKNRGRLAKEAGVLKRSSELGSQGLPRSLFTDT